MDVVATGANALLHDAPSGAQLRVTGTRLSRDAHYDTAPRDARIRLVRAGAMIALRARGLYQLHASAAVDPRGIAWLFAGPSGVGKSTLAYALSRQGWQILGDDGVVLEPTRKRCDSPCVARAAAGERRAHDGVSRAARARATSRT